MKLFNHLRRVAIIGAGPCGTSLLRAFALAQKKGAKIPEVVCYDKQKDWGGLWRFSWQIGFDENGEPTHGSMYRHMFTNVPKEYHEFPDYTYDQHFSKPVPSYLSRQDMYSYLLGRLKDCPEIRKSIKFNTVVRQVEFNTKKDQFIVRAFDTVTGKTNTDYFSHVVVAIGHFSVPEMPSFEGMDEFPGRIVHSHEFRDAQEYVGQTVLIVGGSYSAEDIALQLYKFDAKSITISYRTKPIGHKWPENIKEVPLLVRLEGKTAHFRDGTKKNFDSIILCTGYRHHFPFLSDDLRLITKNRFYPDNLYKGVLLQHQPRIAFLGMQKFYFSFPGLDAETWYVRDYILGRITLPDAETRLKDAAEWQAREALLNSFAESITFMSDYLSDLLSVTDYPPLDLKSSSNKLRMALKHKEEDIVHYRDNTFVSHITGTVSAENTIPWAHFKENVNYSDSYSPKLLLKYEKCTMHDFLENVTLFI